MKFILALLAVLLTTPAQAGHGEASKVGDTPALLAWCHSVDEVKAAIKAMETEGGYIEYIRTPGNTCFDVRIARAAGVPAFPLPATITEIIEVVRIDDTLSIQISLAVDGAGREYHTWHTVEGREA